jgi:hypothetical protein
LRTQLPSSLKIAKDGYMSKTLSPLVRLVLFMICLSIAGSIVAGAHYYAVDLPQQQTLQAPTNLEYECTQCAGLTDIAQKIRCNYVNVCS